MGCSFQSGAYSGKFLGGRPVVEKLTFCLVTTDQTSPPPAVEIVPGGGGGGEKN